MLNWRKVRVVSVNCKLRISAGKEEAWESGETLTLRWEMHPNEVVTNKIINSPSGWIERLSSRLSLWPNYSLHQSILSSSNSSISTLHILCQRENSSLASKGPFSDASKCTQAMWKLLTWMSLGQRTRGYQFPNLQSWHKQIFLLVPISWFSVMETNNKQFVLKWIDWF